MKGTATVIASLSGALLLASAEGSRLSAAERAAAPLITLAIQRDEQWVAQGRTEDGKTLRLMLDTGASLSVLGEQGPFIGAPLTAQAQARLLKDGSLDWPLERGGIEAMTTTGVKEGQLGVAPTVHIQGWTIAGGRLALREDLSQFSPDAAAPALGHSSLDGILGLDSMRGLTWRADYVTGQLTAYDQAPPAHEWQQCVFMTISISPSLPVLRLTLGESMIPVMLDTGDNGELSIPDEGFDALLRKGVFTETGLGFDYGASHEFVATQHGILPGIHIGQQALPRLRVDSASSAPRLGLGALSRLDRFELDFRHYRFCFDSAASPRDSHASQVGAALLSDGNAFVAKAVAPKGVLGMSGLKVDDRLVSVGEVATGPLTQKALYDLLEDPRTREVTVTRGSRTLKLELKSERLSQ